MAETKQVTDFYGNPILMHEVVIAPVTRSASAVCRVTRRDYKRNKVSLQILDFLDPVNAWMAHEIKVKGEYIMRIQGYEPEGEE